MTYFKDVILTFSLHFTDIMVELLLIIYNDRQRKTRFTYKTNSNKIKQYYKNTKNY